MLNVNKYTYTMHAHHHQSDNHHCFTAFANFPKISLLQLGFYHFGSWLGGLLLMFHLFNAILYRFIAVAVSWYCRVYAVLRLTKYIDFLLTSNQFRFCCCYMYVYTWSALVTGYWFMNRFIPNSLLPSPFDHNIYNISVNFSSMEEHEMFGNFIEILCVAMNRNSDWNKFSGHFFCFQFPISKCTHFWWKAETIS